MKKKSGVPYVGPAVDSTNVYASFACPTCGFEQVSNKGAIIFCASCGETTEEIEDVSYKQISASSETNVCPVCEVEIVASTNLDSLHCSQCGSEIEAKVDDSEYEDETNEKETNKKEVKASNNELYVEYLNPISASTKVASAADVKLDLFGDEETPFYNVTIAGNPVGRIHLSDQPEPEEIRAIFSKPSYANSIIEAMEKCGPLEVLQSVNASLFASKVEKSKLASEIRASVEESLEQDVQEKILALRDDYHDAIATTIVGVNKNFFGDVDNPIKGAFYSELEELGINAPDGIVEKVMAEAGSEFFEIVLAKAQELMSKSDEAREEITAAISQANVLRASNTIPKSNLANRLAQGNNIVQIKAAVNSDYSMTKDEMKKRLGLRG